MAQLTLCDPPQPRQPPGPPSLFEMRFGELGKKVGPVCTGPRYCAERTS